MNIRFREILNRFAPLIQEVDSKIQPFIESLDIELLSLKNPHYKHVSKDRFKYLVETQKKRYLLALDLITREGTEGSICDIGCFIPWLPVALSHLGYQVKIVDRYEYYGSAFKDAISGLADRENIQVHELDILSNELDSLWKNEVVLLMAVVEHLNGSPLKLMEKIGQIISKDGFLLFEVPNIVSAFNRIRTFRGLSPLPEYSEYLDSAYPFSGHNREMTVQEVRYLLKKSGFHVEYLCCYNYDNVSIRTWQGKLILFLQTLLPLGNSGQSIMAKACLT